jgi:hypothetical protein
MRVCIWDDCCDKHRNAVLKIKHALDTGNVRKLSGSEYVSAIISLSKIEESFDSVKPKFCVRRIVNWFRRHK